MTTARLSAQAGNSSRDCASATGVPSPSATSPAAIAMPRSAPPCQHMLIERPSGRRWPRVNRDVASSEAQGHPKGRTAEPDVIEEIVLVVVEIEQTPGGHDRATAAQVVPAPAVQLPHEIGAARADIRLGHETPPGPWLVADVRADGAVDPAPVHRRFRAGAAEVHARIQIPRPDQPVHAAPGTGEQGVPDLGVAHDVVLARGDGGARGGRLLTRGGDVEEIGSGHPATAPGFEQPREAELEVFASLVDRYVHLAGARAHSDGASDPGDPGVRGEREAPRLSLLGGLRRGLTGGAGQQARGNYEPAGAMLHRSIIAAAIPMSPPRRAAPRTPSPRPRTTPGSARSPGCRRRRRTAASRRPWRTSRRSP